MVASPSVTWPSAAIAVFPSRRTPITVVERIISPLCDASAQELIQQRSQPIARKHRALTGDVSSDRDVSDVDFASGLDRVHDVLCRIAAFLGPIHRVQIL